MKMKIKKTFFAISIVALIILSSHIISEYGAYFISKEKQIDIEKIISDGITDEEYMILKKQTGLSKSAVCDIMQTNNPLAELRDFQKQNFSEYNVDCNYLFFPVTKAETLNDENGKAVKLKLPPLKTGDILITKSTHTLFFRHGHAALLTNADEAETLEAMMIGMNSDYGTIAGWRRYSSLAVLRPKNLSDNEIEKVVNYAREKLYDVKYDLLSGVFNKTKNETEEILKTHCSHLVWSAYKSQGVDIDSDGGVLILPQDLLKSEKLEVIWSYGINLTK